MNQRCTAVVEFAERILTKNNDSQIVITMTYAAWRISGGY